MTTLLHNPEKLFRPQLMLSGDSSQGISENIHIVRLDGFTWFLGPMYCHLFSHELYFSGGLF